ncbi:MAG TPA: hypothetical protein VKQ30_23190 [Ktedonobacterales bacterium]|nr:hypothetical protein [Ktedonobacterales bacterium]
MGTVDKFLFYIFVLTLVVVAAVYYIGVQTDATAFFSGIQGLWNSASGILPGGQQRGYPSTSGTK